MNPNERGLSMSSDISRRELLRTGGVAGAALLTANVASAAPRDSDAATSVEPSPGPSSSRSKRLSANEKLNIAVVGVANRGADNLGGVRDQNIVALCDVDETLLAAGAKQFPNAKTYNDHRKLLEQKGIDAIVVSTPDHTHAVIAVAAMKEGLHCYCEKPLAHSVAEVRAMQRAAKERNLVTQMGTQIHAGDNYRRVVELIQGGAIGTIKEVHTWCDRVYVQGDRPRETPPVPEGLHWDLWLGPAPERPYHPAYHPFHWREWWDFGGGTLADMACHHMDLPFWALKLGYPLTVEAEGPPPHPESTSPWLIVRYTFPAREALPALPLTWYHGGKRPPQFASGDLPKWGDGNLFVGERGMILADYGRHVLLPETDFKDFSRPSPTIPSSIGHYEEWLRAIRSGGTTTCSFDYSGTLTEAVLLGNVAYRSGKKLDWDARRMRARGCPEADAFIKPAFRKGWTL
jgi:predicted dehydrogenase